VKFGPEKNLQVVERPVHTPGAGEVLVHVHVVSLNYRDKVLVEGTYMPNLPLPIVPASDACGELVAIHGIGGLGHLAIQYSRNLGFKTIAISRGTDKKGLSLKLGAHAYLDTSSGGAAEELQKMGGGAGNPLHCSE
jgi:NADPH:quinone reductase-like Zn-dependent oxidoreductase